MVSNYKKNSTVQLIESGELDEIKQYMIDNKLRRLQFLAHKSFLTDSIVRKKLVQRGIDIKDLLSDVNNTLGKPEKHSTKKALALKAAEKKKHLWKINKVRTDHVKKIKRDQKERLFSQVQNITHRKIIKSGTIKALNKQRVISKHYGQLAEPASVVNYFNISVKFVDALLVEVVGSKLNEIFLPQEFRFHFSPGNL